MNTQHVAISQSWSRRIRLSNTELLAQVKHLARHEREATANLVAHLAELDRRRLYLGEGCSSLFTYCTQILHFSEYAAYGRIQAARAARKFPIVLKLLAQGEIHLTSLGLLAPHLTVENHLDLLAAARHKSKRQVEELVARVRPQPDAATVVRRMPAAAVAATPPTSSEVPAAQIAASGETYVDKRSAEVEVKRTSARPIVTALAPERYRIQVTVDAATHGKLRRAQDLLRHTIPDGDPAAVIDRALTVLLQSLEAQRLAAVARPRTGRPARRGSRHIPASVRRAVWARDGGRCAFVGADRGRCSEKGFLEFHHVKPFAAGGESGVENIELRCRAHNQYEADLYFGGRVPGDSLVRESHGVYALDPTRAMRRCPGRFSLGPGPDPGPVLAGHPTAGPGPSCPPSHALAKRTSSSSSRRRGCTMAGDEAVLCGDRPNLGVIMKATLNSGHDPAWCKPVRRSDPRCLHGFNVHIDVFRGARVPVRAACSSR
jgi:hypothetical protein